MNEKTDKKRFAELMAAMGEAFQKEVTKPAMRIYWEILKQFEYEIVEQAVYSVLSTRTITGTIPVPAEIVQAIENLNGSIDDKAELGWSALLYAIESVGGYGSVQFEDPLIHDTVAALGGWLKITSADNPDWANDKQLQWRRKDFVSLYKIMAKHGGRSIPYLIGIHEAENKGTYDEFVPKITKIGGKPGQYIACHVDVSRELSESHQNIKFIEDVCEKVTMEARGE